MQAKNLFQSEAFFKLVVVIGALCTLLSILLGWGGLEFGINVAIRKTTKLVPGSQLWKSWKSTRLPVYMKFYFFNITNPEEILDGAKPLLTEMGPYVYLVAFDKLNIEKDKLIDTYLYSPTKTSYFQPDKSTGREDDLVTYINIMHVTLSHIAHDSTNVNPGTLDRILTEKGERLTRTHKIKDLLFDGVSIQSYVDVMKDPLVIRNTEYANLLERYKDGYFALFKGKNGTKDDRWECHSGIRNIADVGKLHSYNGKTSLNLYNDNYCNTINGTDGTLYPPFIIPGQTDLNIFIPELCRSIRWEFVKMLDSDGVTVARYRFPQIKTMEEDTNLRCFCLKRNITECDGIHGITSVVHCFDGIPLLFSKPHFLNVHASIRNQVDGIRPNVFVHESKLDVYPLTGAIITSSIKMQFSIELLPWESMQNFRKVSRSIIPIVWVELSSSLSGMNFIIVRVLSLFLKLFPILRMLALLGSLGIVFIGYFFSYRCRKGKMLPESDEIEEHDADARDEHELWMHKFKNQTPADSSDASIEIQ